MEEITRHQALPNCDKCDKAKKLLEEKGLKYSFFNADKKFFWIHDEIN